MYEINSGAIKYYQYQWDVQYGSFKFSFLMGMIQCYASLDTDNGRFAWSLLPIFIDMIKHVTMYAWVPILLVQCYIDLFFYPQDHIASFLVIITLQAQAYEHIAVDFPPRLLIPSFASHIEYLASIMRRREDFYIHPIDCICKDIHFYCTMLTQLVPFIFSMG